LVIFVENAFPGHPVTSDAGNFDPCEFRRLQESSAMHGLVASAHCSREAGDCAVCSRIVVGAPTHCVPTTLPPLSGEDSLRPGPASADPSDLASSTACAIAGATATQTSSNNPNKRAGRILKFDFVESMRFDQEDLTSQMAVSFKSAPSIYFQPWRLGTAF
jgi:hypothetical protein